MSITYSGTIKVPYTNNAFYKLFCTVCEAEIKPRSVCYSVAYEKPNAIQIECVSYCCSTACRDFLLLRLG